MGSHRWVGMVAHQKHNIEFSQKMELDQVRERALNYQSILKYLEPRVEMKLFWKSCVDIGTCYIENISNTIRKNANGYSYERISNSHSNYSHCVCYSNEVSMTQKIMME